MATYITELQHLSEHCEFGSALNEMLCDRLVCGVEEPKIQQRLLAEPDLSYDKAFELALALQSSDKNAKDLQPTASPTFNQVQHKSPFVTIVEINIVQQTASSKQQNAANVVKRTHNLSM